MLEVMSRYSLPLRMLLCPGSPRIEEIVHALESTTSLSGNLSILAQRVLQLDI
jgi:hypothetical protein